MSSPPPYLICEGYEDVEFFKYLIEERKLPGFKVIDTRKPQERSGSISKIGAKLNSIRNSNINRFSQIPHIVIVIDCDDDPNGNFENVKNQIEKYFPGQSPDKPFDRSKSSPSFSIAMIPWEKEAGNLEKLCLEPAKSINGDLRSKIEQFMATVNADKWPETRKSKAWLRAYLPVACERDPSVTLGTVFNDHRELIPANHETLNRISDYLASFA